jgi:ligand-binding sensor domain-containing protein/serine phosphatase RsbU (regulator of sigma subunit)
MFFRKNILLLFLLLIFSSAQFSLGQSPFFKSVSLLKNRQPFSVKCIFQDSKGYLWLSTSEGLIRYDGVDSYIFGIQDSIKQSPITAISEDTLHQIWIGHKDGILEYLKNNYFTKFKPEEGLSHSEISFIKFDSKGVLWFGTLGEGIYFYKGKIRERIYNINNDDGLNDNYAYTMAEANNGEIYVGTDNGISIIDINKNKVSGVITMKKGLPDNIVKHLEFEGQKLWIGMDEKGICTYDIKEKKFSLMPSWNFGTLNTFTLLNSNECWVSTKNSGVVKIEFDKKGLTSTKQFSEYNGASIEATQTVIADREKNIWIGTNKELILIAASAFEFIDKKSDGFDYGSTFNFITDNNHHFWAATQHGLFCISADNTGQFKQKTRFLPNQKEIQDAFISLYLDSKGFIWAGTYGYGVYRINPENMSYTKYNITNGMPDNNILHISGKGNNVWLATAGGGGALFNLNNSSIKKFNDTNGLGSNYLYSIFNDSKGNTWFALDGKGTTLLKNGKCLNNFLPDSLGVNTIYAITEDLDGALWFLTSEKGLLRYFNRTFKFFNETNGLKTNSVRSIIRDKYGNIVIASNEGMQIYNCEAAGFETFCEEKGVAYLEPNLNGISSDSSGFVWISTNKGVIRYTPVSFNKHEIKPKISISRKLLFFNPIDNSKYKFRYNQNHFTFDYAGIWFQSGENLLYRYKLENYDFDWSLPSHTRSVTYSNLPPGDFIFKVEVSHKLGQWVSSTDAVFVFKIYPPFYKTWWFITISIISILLLIFYYIKSRTAKLLKAKEDLELEVQKRTKTIMQQKEEIETQRDEIEAQRDFVTAQRDKISLQNDNITSSIHYASRIQNAILPPIEEYDLRLKDYFIFNRPMDIVSGDFYWIASRNSRVFVAVADCTGHGVSGAFMSILGTSLLYKIVNSSENLNAAQILDQLREEIKYALRQTGKMGEAQDGMDISLIILENNKQNYQFAGANNSAYIIRENKLIELVPDKMPIGIYPFEESFKNNVGSLYKNDLIYLFSDGFKDQLGGPTDTKIKSKPFQALLLKNSHSSMEEQLQALNNFVDDWKAGKHQNDDILVLGFRIT